MYKKKRAKKFTYVLLASQNSWQKVVGYAIIHWHRNNL